MSSIKSIIKFFYILAIFYKEYFKHFLIMKNLTSCEYGCKLIFGKAVSDLTIGWLQGGKSLVKNIHHDSPTVSIHLGQSFQDKIITKTDSNIRVHFPLLEPLTRKRSSLKKIFSCLPSGEEEIAGENHEYDWSAEALAVVLV